MTDYGTIKIPRDEYERHNEKRENQNLSWAEYIDGQAPEISNNAELDTESLLTSMAEDRQEQLEEVISAYCSDTATKEDIGDIADLIKKLQQALESLDVSVDVEQSSSGMDESDVQNIVERELEKTFGDRLPQ